jgi:nitrite reductase/ring-hydroxylating ferredoxin subunit
VGDVAQETWIPIDHVDLSVAEFPIRTRVHDQDVLIFRVGDGYRGVQRTCPHQRASLADASIVGDGRMLRCAMHGYTFKLADGKGVNCPGYRIRVFEVSCSEGQLRLFAAV